MSGVSETFVTVIVIAQKAKRTVKLYLDFGCWISMFILTLKYLKNVYSPYIIFALLFMMINNRLTVIQLCLFDVSFFNRHKPFFSRQI